MLGGGTDLDVHQFALWVILALAASTAVPVLRPRWIVGHPRLTLLVLLVVSVLAAATIYRTEPIGMALEIDPSSDPLLPLGDPAKELYKSAVLDFGDDEVFVIAIECDEVFTVTCLSTIDRVTTRIAQLDQVRSVASLMDVTSFRWVAEEEWVEVRPFIEEVPGSSAELAELRRRALHDPVYRRTIVSEDGRAAAINVSFRKMSDAEFIASGLDDRVQQILREEMQPDQNFYVAGRPHIKVHVYFGMLRDLKGLVPMGAVVMAVCMWFFTGSRRQVLIPIVNAMVAILWTFGVVATIGQPLTLLTCLLAPMLLAIGTVYGIHVISRYQEEAALGDNREQVVIMTLQHLIVPVTIAGLTTMVGFAALLITDIPAVFDLGVFSIVGIASITLLSLTSAPAALALLPLRSAALAVELARGGRAAEGSKRVADRVIGGFLELLVKAVSSRSGLLIAAGSVAAVISAIAIPQIVIDTDYLSYFDEQDPVRRDFEAVNRLLAGAVPIYVVLDGREPGIFREPDVLTTIETLQAEFDNLQGVSRTLSSVNMMKTLNRAFNEGDPRFEKIPETRPAVSELLFMMPKGDISKYTTVNHGRGNMIVRTGEVGSAAIKALVAKIQGVLDRTEFPPGVRSGVTGNAVLLSRSADGIARSQPQSVGLAAITIFVLISLGLRSVKLGAIAMVPNLLPVLVFFGLLGLGAAPLSLPTSLIGSVALGIAIDDTVHFLVRYRRERETGASSQEAAATCGYSIGRPIAITSVVISLGFLVVALSEFASLREFGYLAAATMVICLITDLLILPAILVRTDV